jgi:hypothetical protein
LSKRFGEESKQLIPVVDDKTYAIDALGIIGLTALMLANVQI